MKNLFLTLEPPYPLNDGGIIRTHNLLRQLSSTHEITLVTFVETESDKNRLEALRPLCADTWALLTPGMPQRSIWHKMRDLLTGELPALYAFRSDEMGQLLRGLAERGRFDVAHVDHIYMAQYLPQLASLPVVLNHPDVEYLAQKRWLALNRVPSPVARLLRRLTLQRWREFELWASSSCDTSLAVSAPDAAYFRRHVPAVPVVVVPNGVDTAFFSPDRRATSSDATLLYTGNMSYPPNVEAMRWFREAILPHIWQACPRARLVIAGRDPAAEVRQMGQEERIAVTGTVEDIRPYFEDATVYVVPLRTGGGTRLKIGEAMAMAKPIVSTSLGCEGLPVTAEEDIIIADGPAEFAAAVVGLLQDGRRRSRMAERARETAKKRMDWAAGRDRLHQAYELAIRHHGTRRQLGR